MLTMSLPKSIGNYRNLLPTNPPAPVGTSLEQDVERCLISYHRLQRVTPLNDYPCTSLVIALYPVIRIVSGDCYTP